MTIAMEECCEIAGRISKAKRFGMFEIQPGQAQALDNRQRIREEFNDLVAVLSMIDEGLVVLDPEMIQKKKAKVLHFLEYSKQVGTLVE